MLNLARSCRSTLATLVITLVVCGASAGCRGGKTPPTTQPARLSDRSDAALTDPFGYAPTFDRTDISGGDVDKFDKKGMDRDLNSIFNP